MCDVAGGNLKVAEAGFIESRITFWTPIWDYGHNEGNYKST